MFSTGIQGNLSQFETGSKEIDYVQLNWSDANKHILHLSTQAGRNIGIRKPGGFALHDGDVIYNDDHLVVAVNVKPCEVLRVHLHDVELAAHVGYELGKRHLPVFITQNMLEIPFDESTERYLLRLGFSPKRVQGVFRGRPSTQQYQ